MIFTKCHVFGKYRGLDSADNQVDTKEALPAWIMPLFLLCNANTFWGEMHIAIFRVEGGDGEKEVRICYIGGWWI